MPSGVDSRPAVAALDALLANLVVPADYRDNAFVRLGELLRQSLIAPDLSDARPRRLSVEPSSWFATGGAPSEEVAARCPEWRGGAAAVPCLPARGPGQLTRPRPDDAGMGTGRGGRRNARPFCQHRRSSLLVRLLPAHPPGSDLPGRRRATGTPLRPPPPGAGAQWLVAGSRVARTARQPAGSPAARKSLDPRRRPRQRRRPAPTSACGSTRARSRSPHRWSSWEAS